MTKPERQFCNLLAENRETVQKPHVFSNYFMFIIVRHHQFTCSAVSTNVYSHTHMHELQADFGSLTANTHIFFLHDLEQFAMRVFFV